MNLIETVELFCEKNELIPSNSTVIIGLSGGADSVFLLHFLYNYAQKHPIRLIVAHLDHQWRTESAHDRLFCQQLAASLQLPFESAQVSELPEFKYKGSPEEKARNQRRYFFTQLYQKYPNSLVALAHHADDQQETFFIRLIRGTTLSGLCGMQPKQDFYIRPLLGVYKQQILDYLKEQQIEYKTDITNESDNYLRNRIRHFLLPAARKCDERFDNNFFTTLSHLQEANNFLQKLVETTFYQLVSTTPNSPFRLNNDQFSNLAPFLQRQILLFWLIQEKVPFEPSAALFDEIMRFLGQNGSKTHTFYNKWQIIKENGYFYIKSLE